MTNKKTIRRFFFFLMFIGFSLVITLGCAYVNEDNNVSASVTLEGLAEETGEGMLGAAPDNIIGISTVNLSPWEIKNIDIPLAANKTKLVIPDNVNVRIVQIDDMSGANWQTSSFSGGNRC